MQWPDAVSERTKNGELTIDAYANAQLGAEEDVIIEQMRMGANIGHKTDFARLGNYVPERAVHARKPGRREEAQQLDCVKEWKSALKKNSGLKAFFRLCAGLP